MDNYTEYVNVFEIVYTLKLNNWDQRHPNSLIR